MLSASKMRASDSPDNEIQMVPMNAQVPKPTAVHIDVSESSEAVDSFVVDVTSADTAIPDIKVIRSKRRHRTKSLGDVLSHAHKKPATGPPRPFYRSQSRKVFLTSVLAGGSGDRLDQSRLTMKEPEIETVITETVTSGLEACPGGHGGAGGGGGGTSASLASVGEDEPEVFTTR